MNTVLFTSPGLSARTQLWRVLKKSHFHMGDFVRQILVDNDKKQSGVAKKMDVSGQTFSDMLNQVTIGEERLFVLSKAARLDIIGAVRKKLEQMAKEHGTPLPRFMLSYKPDPSPYGEAPESITVSEPSQAARTPLQVTVSIDTNDPNAREKFEALMKIMGK